MNNTFEITQSLNTCNPVVQVKLTLNPAIEDTIMNVIRDAYLLPVLQGSRQVTVNGQAEYRFWLPVEDAGMLKNALLLAYTKHSVYNTGN